MDDKWKRSKIEQDEWLERMGLVVMLRRLLTPIRRTDRAVAHSKAGR